MAWIPEEAAACITWPVPMDEVRMGSRASGGRRASPLAVAISTTAMTAASSRVFPRSALARAGIRPTETIPNADATGSPRGPVASTVFSDPPAARVRIPANPSPPSESGQLSTW